MDLGLHGKAALVTGASKGIGKGIALRLAQEGCSVAITARGGDDLRAVAAEIQTAGGDALAVEADVTRADDCARVVAETAARFGSVDVLVNNAGGVGRFAAFSELSDDDWEQIFNLNILSVVRITREAVPLMQKRQWGRIINIASESAVQPDANMPHYNAAKAALINLTKSLSKAYGGDGILVNAVSPAFIKTPLVDAMLAAMAAEQSITPEQALARFLREFRPNIVLHRAGTIEETAAVVAFLASEAASFVTGSNYRVDGGSVASV